MTRITKPSLKIRTRNVKRNITDKLTINKMKKWSICPDSSSESSSDDEVRLILPCMSSDQLSIIEESHLENACSVSSSSSSNYLSSIINGSISSLSLNGFEQSYETAEGETASTSRNFHAQHAVMREINEHIVEINGSVENIADDPSQSTSQLVEGSTDVEEMIAVDVNGNHQGQNFAQALMNIALLAANANQLKYLLETSENRPLFYISLSFIIVSLIVQLLVKVCLMINYRYNLSNQIEAQKALRVTNFTTCAILLITIINVAITGIILAEINI